MDFIIGASIIFVPIVLFIAFIVIAALIELFREYKEEIMQFIGLGIIGVLGVFGIVAIIFVTSNIANKSPEEELVSSQAIESPMAEKNLIEDTLEKEEDNIDIINLVKDIVAIILLILFFLFGYKAFINPKSNNNHSFNDEDNNSILYSKSNGLAVKESEINNEILELESDNLKIVKSPKENDAIKIHESLKKANKIKEKISLSDLESEGKMRLFESISDVEKEIRQTLYRINDAQVNSEIIDEFYTKDAKKINETLKDINEQEQRKKRQSGETNVDEFFK